MTQSLNTEKRVWNCIKEFDVWEANPVVYISVSVKWASLGVRSQRKCRGEQLRGKKTQQGNEELFREEETYFHQPGQQGQQGEKEKAEPESIGKEKHGWWFESKFLPQVPSDQERFALSLSCVCKAKTNIYTSACNFEN